MILPMQAAKFPPSPDLMRVHSPDYNPELKKAPRVEFKLTSSTGLCKGESRTQATGEGKFVVSMGLPNIVVNRM